MLRRLSWLMIFAVTPLSAQGLRVPYDSLTLANGLQVLVAPDHAVPVVTVNIWYHVGSGDEKPGRTGFAHLFEHIMFMGSQHVPRSEEHTSELQSHLNLVCRLLLEKKKNIKAQPTSQSTHASPIRLTASTGMP